MNQSTLVKNVGRSRLVWSAILAGALASPSGAFAHHVMNLDQHPFLGGLTLPIHGPDHIVAMIAIGIWAIAGNRGRWLIPASFLAFMLVGMGLGMARVGFPLVEQGILLSVCAFGVIIALLVKLPFWGTAIIAGFFALFHGYACGADLPNQWATAFLGLSYAVGLILCTAGLIAVGYGLGVAVKKSTGEVGLRVAGGLIAAAGIYFFATA